MPPLLQRPIEINAAVVRDAAEGFRMERLRLGELGPRDVLVRIAGVGLCHTDLAATGPAGAGLHPAVLGHEGSGVVEEIGHAVTGVVVGDHVVLSYDSCGHCHRCRAGKAYLCESWQDLNTGAGRTRTETTLVDANGEPVNGSWFGQSSLASYAVASDTNVVRVADDLPLDILGPLGCGFLTGAGTVVNALGVRPGESIVIFGAGAVGLAAVMAAKICNAKIIVAVDPVQTRRKLAAQFGATHTFDALDPDLAARITAATGRGADYCFDTSGVPSVIATAVGALTPGGVCGLVAQAGTLELASRDIVFGRSVVGTFLGHSSPHVLVPTMIEWWRGGLFPFDALIERFPLSGIRDAVAASKRGDVVKPVLIP